MWLVFDVIDGLQVVADAGLINRGRRRREPKGRVHAYVPTSR